MVDPRTLREVDVTGTARRLLQPALVVLVLAGIFHLIRGAPIDGAVFCGMAVLIGADAVTGHRLRLPVVPRPPRWVVWPAAIGCAILLGTTARWGTTAHVVLPIIGGAAVLSGWHRSGDATAGPASWRQHAGGAGWAAIAVALCLWELTTYILQQITADDRTHPALSDLLNPLVDTHVGRGLLVLVWMLAGVALLWPRRRPAPQKGSAP